MSRSECRPFLFVALAMALGCGNEPSGIVSNVPGAGGGGSENSGTGPGIAGNGSLSGSGGASANAGGSIDVVGGAGGGGSGSGAGGATVPTTDAGVAAGSSALSGCALTFPYQDEPTLGTWLGGDSAYSTLLTPTTALWSFQDTFVGKHGQTGRAGAGLIANSLAIITCANGVQSIHYVWGLVNNGARAIFSDGVANQRFWPQQPFIYKGTLFAAMTRVQGGATEIGTALARVANPMDHRGSGRSSTSTSRRSRGSARAPWSSRTTLTCSERWEAP